MYVWRSRQERGRFFPRPSGTEFLVKGAASPPTSFQNSTPPVWNNLVGKPNVTGVYFSIYLFLSKPYSEVRLINRFTIVNQVAQSLVLIQEAIPASCADYNLAALYFYTYILYI